MKFLSVYITAPDAKEARRIAMQLVKERLIACANIIPDIGSLYWWDNEIKSHGEAAIIAKTKASNAKKIIRMIKECHPYKVPCVVFWPIVDGNRDFLQWIEEETKRY